jgi:hypothetical protein
VTGWVVLFVCVAAAAVSVAARPDRCAECPANAEERMAEWCRRHMGADREER